MTASDDAAARVLIRATVLDERVMQFADDMAAASGCPAVLLIDESRGRVDPRGRDVLGISSVRCRELGLYCPSDFAWKCGDYGYYLARKAFPEVAHFWMLEYDVRISGEDPAEFFRFFKAHAAVDFLTGGLVEAGSDWWWTATARSRNARPYRCFFPVTRLSASAIDAAFAARIRHSTQISRRILWPNDEAHVATTLKNASFSCRDLNSFGRKFYSDDTYGFDSPIDGDVLVLPRTRVLLFHPVLYGETYRRKKTLLAQDTWGAEAFVRRWGVRINRRRRW